MKKARDAIRKGKFKEFRDKVIKVYKRADADVKSK